LLSAHKLPGEAKQEIAEIAASAERAASLVNQLLAFSRKQVLHPRSVDLNDLVKDLSRMLERLIPANIRLITELDRKIGLIKADPVQLQQVIINLAANARDSMPGGGSVTIATRSVVLDAIYGETHPEVVPGPYVQLTVSDSGHGMDEETKEHLFEPFYTTKQVGQGTGLGLASVFGTVKQSNGYICVDSEPGRGSAITIYLPEFQGTPEAPTPGPAPRQKKGSGETILLVEDDPARRQMTCTILTRAGYTVLSAANGREALALIGGAPDAGFQLLVTDVVMPEIGGTALAARARERFPHLKVLYMSGYTREGGVRQAIRDSDGAFIEKPFLPGSLVELVG